MLAMVSELALVLQCDVPVHDPLNTERPNLLPDLLSKYFIGPHFNWSRPATLHLGGKSGKFTTVSDLTGAQAILPPPPTTTPTH